MMNDNVDGICDMQYAISWGDGRMPGMRYVRETKVLPQRRGARYNKASYMHDPISGVNNPPGTRKSIIKNDSLYIVIFKPSRDDCMYVWTQNLQFI